MANLFNHNDRNNKNTGKDNGGFWSTAAVIGVAILGAMAEVGNSQNAYNEALRTMEVVVPRYAGRRNRTIPSNEWERLERAEKVFEQRACTTDGAAENAAAIHAILISNRKFGSSTATTRQNTDGMSLAEAQSINGIYESKFGGNEYLLPRTIVLSEDEKKRLFKAAVVLRENRRSYNADYLEAILAHA